MYPPESQRKTTKEIIIFLEAKRVIYSTYEYKTAHTVTRRNDEKEYRRMLGNEFSREDYLEQEGQEHIKQVEGIIIEDYRKANGDFP